MPFREERDAAVAAHTQSLSRAALLHLTPHERHRCLLKDHARFYGAQVVPAAAMRTDADALAEGHRFLREPEDEDASWEARVAARYYAKLFREYAVADLSCAAQRRVGLRWRTKAEVLAGKGQFSCGVKACDAGAGLASYELLFDYREAGVSKQALVKLRCCPSCAELLHTARGGEKACRKRRRGDAAAAGPESAAGDDPAQAVDDAPAAAAAEAAHWSAPLAAVTAEEAAETEMDAFLAALFP